MVLTHHWENRVVFRLQQNTRRLKADPNVLMLCHSIANTALWLSFSQLQKIVAQDFKLFIREVIGNRMPGFSRAFSCSPFHKLESVLWDENLQFLYDWRNEMDKTEKKLLRFRAGIHSKRGDKSNKAHCNPILAQLLSTNHTFWLFFLLYFHLSWHLLYSPIPILFLQ